MFETNNTKDGEDCTYSFFKLTWPNWGISLLNFCDMLNWRNQTCFKNIRHSTFSLYICCDILVFWQTKISYDKTLPYRQDSFIYWIKSQILQRHIFVLFLADICWISSCHMVMDSGCTQTGTRTYQYILYRPISKYEV